MRYRNIRHGRIVERPAEDEWLEASAGWERLDEPGPAEPAADKTPDDGDEREDD